MIKRILLCMLAFAASISFVRAQTSDYRWAWPVSFNLNNYDGDLGNEIVSFSDGSFGVNTGIRYYLNSSIDAGLDIGVDRVNFEDFQEDPGKAFLSLHYKFNNGYLLKEDAFFKPYLTGGAGAISQFDRARLLFPVGGGIRLGVAEGIDLNFQAIYNFIGNGDIPGNYDFFQLGTGVVVQLGGGEAKDSDGDGVPDKVDICPDEAGPATNNGCPLPKDTDGDGVIDDNDQCVNEAGPASNNGCPLPKDSDGDGVIDDEDDCPNVAGLASLNGCPDSDGDGIADKDDACPREAGKASLNGCPDSDNDGIADKDDKCIHEAGPASNNGCPELSEEEEAILLEALEGVQFQTGSDIITRSSYSKLDNVVGLLNKHEDFKLKISGYTDNTGNEQKNLELSDRRAKAARQYIVDKGIASNRITAQGFGIANPVATNSTAAGRAKNRRVEFEVVQ